jgi:hypothetical protein
MEREALTVDTLSVAMAAHNSGGLVVAQVERVADLGTLNPRQVKIPGALVDCIVVATNPDHHMQTIATPYNPAFASEVRVPLTSLEAMPLDDSKIIARRAAMELRPHSVVNLGVGISEGVAAFYTSIGQKTVWVKKELPGHVANRLQAALGREVYYLVSEGIVSATDVDTALSWGPGLRWGIMGNMMLNHLGGGPGGIEHFFHQFAGPMSAWWKTLGSPVLSPEVQKKLIDGVHAEVGSRSVQELEHARDEILLGLIELRKRPETVAPREVAAE